MGAKMLMVKEATKLNKLKRWINQKLLRQKKKKKTQQTNVSMQKVRHAQLLLPYMATLLVFAPLSDMASMVHTLHKLFAKIYEH